MRPRDRPSSDNRAYTFCGITYLKAENFKILCDASGLVRHWCCIWHHSDKNEDGSPKEPHLHFIITVFYQHSAKLIKKKFDILLGNYNGNNHCSFLCQACEDVKLSFEYLTHKNDPDKFLYRQSEIVSDDIRQWTVNRDGGKNEEFFRDIGQLTRMQMCFKYGRDYMKNYLKYEEFYREAVSEELFARYDTSIRDTEDKIIQRSQEFKFDFERFK